MSTSSSDPSDRLRDLPAAVRANAVEAQRALERGDLDRAIETLDAALKEAPAHPELLRLCGLLELFRGEPMTAVALLRKATTAWPHDGLIASNLGAALAQRGDIGLATEAFRRATELDPLLADAWFNLGRALDLQHDAAGAHAAFSGVLEVDPRHLPARILRAETAKTLGRLDESEAELRDVVRIDPDSVSAWVALANLKSFRPDADDLRTVEQLRRNANVSATQRVDLDFAYAGLLETDERFPAAFAAYRDANVAKRATLQWDAAAVSAMVDAIIAAFPSASSSAANARGDDLVFLVGMPRSGSTLAEQVLAAHPDVSAGGETGWIADIVRAESNRRRTRFPAWASDASDEDWARLGDDYLDRVALKRRPETVFTDKTLTNWQTLGAIRRMLPRARIVNCRRDPLETAWSCYKHNFASDQLWSYDIVEIAAFFGDTRRTMRHWIALFEHAVHVHTLETLIAHPDTAVKALLAHCGLPFDARCLRFHEADREVRTASAAQVRRPLRSSANAASRYGGALDPLRRLIENAAIE